MKNTDYRETIKNHLEGMAKGGHGQLKKLADHLRVNPTLVSQVMTGRKDFTVEQALSTAEFLGLSPIEKEAFVLMVQISRAGTHDLKFYFEEKLKLVREESQKIAKRVRIERELNDSEKIRFYSNWIYSVIRLSTSIDGLQTVETISEKLEIPRAKVTGILEFLVETGLCKKDGNLYSMGPSRTHIPAGSPMVTTHHRNWRFKALEKMESQNEEGLHYSVPMSISKKDAAQLKELLLKLISKSSDIVKPSKAEEVFCMNIDFFKV